jgi:SAM-dependent methyltransferase
MNGMDRRAHWESVYACKRENEVSWFEESPTISLDLIKASGAKPTSSIIDVGAGASRLVDALLDDGYEAIAVLDLAERALATVKARLGPRASKVQWIVADITAWEPSHPYDVWHDRAVLHFMTAPNDRAAYAERVRKAVRSRCQVIIGTFAPDGPERCSGLPVMRHDAASLGALLGPSFELIESRVHNHQTPHGATQRFQFSRFQRNTPPALARGAGKATGHG